MWIGGGWGVDALVGEETREHRDLGLMHRHEQERALLTGAGFAQSTEPAARAFRLLRAARVPAGQ